MNSPPVTEASSAQPVRIAWRVHYTLFLLTVIYTLNYLDRYTFSVVLQAIKVDMHLSDASLGLLAGFAFVLCYSILGIPIGRLADRYNRRNIITAGLLVWSAMTVATGLAQNVFQMGVARFLMGAGEATGVAPSNSMVADLYSKASRPFAMAVLASGSSIGLFLGYWIGGLVSQQFGWRHAFFVAGLPGVAIAILFFLTVCEPARGEADGTSVRAELPTFRETVRFLAGAPTFIYLVLGGSVLGIFLYASIVWSAPMMIRVHHMTPARVGAVLGATRGTAGLIGILLGGTLASYLGKFDERWRAWVPAFGCLLIVPAELLFLYSDQPVVFVAAYTLASFCSAMTLGPQYAIVLNVATVNMRAVASAIFLFFVNLVGQIVGPYAVGLLSDTLKGLYGSEAIRYSMLVGPVAAAFAAIFFYLASRHIVCDTRRATQA